MKLILCCFMLFVEGLFYFTAVRYFDGKYHLVKKESMRWNMYIALSFPVMIGAWLWRERLLYGTGILSFTAFLCFVLVAWIDFESMRIPNELCGVLMLLGLLAILWNVTAVGLDSLGFHSLAGVKLWERLLGFFIVSVPLLLANELYVGAFGAGDVKLMAAAGFYLGYRAVVKAAVVGSVVAAIVFVILLIIKKISLKDKIAFGPYLCVGLIYVLLCP